MAADMLLLLKRDVEAAAARWHEVPAKGDRLIFVFIIHLCAEAKYTS
ncbi:MAG: hypothetical protein KME30_07845 [Iphinoe sp. HA4291-MV1]|jgi:hypothetical protein|nr:hypothetical protein [Iphinoe sp. HA4291-MV1]